MSSTIATIAKQVRADIKAARTAGTLGDLPDALKISVRSRDGDTLDINLDQAPAEWARHDLIVPGCSCGPQTPEGCLHPDLISPAARATGDAILALCEARRREHEFGFHVFVFERDTVVSAYYHRH
ncbi:hypothetical protein AB0395_34760 [Streptosporangium sp. NPDC051023]|uniref:hypothetical protein n=1 Tax=Streptosporangium sp. NPDC051023 TaxID=3155410 RepID=UPI00344EAB96